MMIMQNKYLAFQLKSLALPSFSELMLNCCMFDVVEQMDGMDEKANHNKMFLKINTSRKNPKHCLSLPLLIDLFLHCIGHTKNNWRFFHQIDL